LDWSDALWTRDPDTTEALVSGLRQRPDSLLRAALMRDLPPAPATPGDTSNPKLDWYGLTQETYLLSMLYNLLGSVYGKPGNKPSIDPPSRAVDPITAFWNRLHHT